MRIQRIWPALLLALAATACDDDVQEPGAGDVTLTEQEAEDVAQAVGAQVYADMDAEFAAPAFDVAAPSASPGDAGDIVTRVFEHMRPCTHGGSVTFAGTSTAEIDRAAQHIVIETQATRTHEDCVLPLRRRRLQIELDGAPAVEMDAHFERQFGMPLGAQTVSLEGAVDWAILDSDRAGTCEIDLDIAWERTLEGGYHTVDGMACGREVHVETIWQTEGEVES